MCHKTYNAYACGCTKLRTLFFCAHIDAAEHLIRDNGMHHYGDVRQFDTLVYLKSVHDSHAADAAVSCGSDDDDGGGAEEEQQRITRFVQERFEELRAWCERDAVLSTRAVEGVCEVCGRWALPEGVVYVGRGVKRLGGE